MDSNKEFQSVPTKDIFCHENYEVIGWIFDAWNETKDPRLPNFPSFSYFSPNFLSHLGIPEKFGSGFGYFWVFAHSTHHYILISDWKQCRVSSPNSDLAFFFLSSTSQSMRAKYTQDWLEQYYFSFTECLRSKFGIKLANVYPEFDFDVFCKDFKKHVYRAYLQVLKSMNISNSKLENRWFFPSIWLVGIQLLFWFFQTEMEIRKFDWTIQILKK